VIFQVREFHGDREEIAGRSDLFDVGDVRLRGLAREQFHHVNDPRWHTSRDQLSRGRAANFDYIVQPRDSLGVLSFHLAHNPLDVLDVGVPGALLDLAGVGLARNILGKQEERAGLRYCSDR
jgi:hypothetical protein